MNTFPSLGILLLAAAVSTARAGGDLVMVVGLPGSSQAVAGQSVQSLPGQIVAPLPGEIVPPLPGQSMPALPGQIVQALPGQIVPPLPGQIVPALPGELVPALPGQVVRALPVPLSPQPFGLFTKVQPDRSSRAQTNHMAKAPPVQVAPPQASRLIAQVRR